MHPPFLVLPSYFWLLRCALAAFELRTLCSFLPPISPSAELWMDYYGQVAVTENEVVTTREERLCLKRKISISKPVSLD